MDRLRERLRHVSRREIGQRGRGSANTAGLSAAEFGSRLGRSCWAKSVAAAYRRRYEADILKGVVLDRPVAGACGRSGS
jgi:hypothetical protein